MEQIAAALALNARNEVSWRSALRYHKEARTTLLEMLEHSGDHERRQTFACMLAARCRSDEAETPAALPPAAAGDSSHMAALLQVFLHHQVDGSIAGRRIGQITSHVKIAYWATPVSSVRGRGEGVGRPSAKTVGGETVY